MASEKDPGIQPLVIADTFEQASNLTAVERYLERYMIVSLDWRRVLAFYAEWAARVRELNPPASGRPTV